MPPPEHKNDTIHISGHKKQKEFLVRNFGLYYLVGSKEAKSDEFSEIGVPL